MAALENFRAEHLAYDDNDAHIPAHLVARARTAAGRTIANEEQHIPSELFDNEE